MRQAPPPQTAPQSATTTTATTTTTTTTTIASDTTITHHDHDHHGRGKQGVRQPRTRLAPFARVELGDITNKFTVRLHGGSIAAALQIGADASINTDAIEVPSSTLPPSLLLTATEIKDGTTTIRTVDRPPRRLAIRSWRVVH